MCPIIVDRRKKKTTCTYRGQREEGVVCTEDLILYFSSVRITLMLEKQVSQKLLDEICEDLHSDYLMISMHNLFS